jgi:hypothetical protein
MCYGLTIKILSQPETGGIEAEKGKYREGSACIAGSYWAVVYHTSLVDHRFADERLGCALCGICHGRSIGRSFAFTQC